MQHAIDPKIDCVFKALLGSDENRNLLVHFLNAFSAMLKRNRINIIQAQFCIRAYRKIPIKFVDVHLGQTLKIVDQLKIYAYDAYLIQCAQQSKSALLTLDNGLIYAAKSVGIQVLEL